MAMLPGWLTPGTLVDLPNHVLLAQPSSTFQDRGVLQRDTQTEAPCPGVAYPAGYCCGSKCDVATSVTASVNSSVMPGSITPDSRGAAVPAGTAPGEAGGVRKE
jgi:hypothetical protein